MILKDYPEEVFNTTQQLLIQLQQLPDIPLSSNRGSDLIAAVGCHGLRPGSNSNAESFASEHEVFEIKKKRKPINIEEAQYCRETFYY